MAAHISDLLSLVMAADNEPLFCYHLLLKMCREMPYVGGVMGRWVPTNRKILYLSLSRSLENQSCTGLRWHWNLDRFCRSAFLGNFSPSRFLGRPAGGDGQRQESVLSWDTAGWKSSAIILSLRRELALWHTHCVLTRTYPQTVSSASRKTPDLIEMAIATKQTSLFWEILSYSCLTGNCVKCNVSRSSVRILIRLWFMSWAGKIQLFTNFHGVFRMVRTAERIWRWWIEVILCLAAYLALF